MISTTADRTNGERLSAVPSDFRAQTTNGYGNGNSSTTPSDGYCHSDDRSLLCKWENDIYGKYQIADVNYSNNNVSSSDGGKTAFEVYSKSEVIVNSLLCFLDNFRLSPDIDALIRRHFDAEAIDGATDILHIILGDKSIDIDKCALPEDVLLQHFDTLRLVKGDTTKFVAADLSSLPLAVEIGSGPSIADVYREIQSLQTNLQQHLRCLPTNSSAGRNRARQFAKLARLNDRSPRTLRVKSFTSRRHFGLSQPSQLPESNSNKTVDDTNNRLTTVFVEKDNKMLPNFLKNNSGEAAPLENTAYYQASAPTALLTPALNNATCMDTLTLLSAAAASSSAAQTAALPTATGNTPSKAVMGEIPTVKKRRLDNAFQAHAHSNSSGGNRLDRAVRKLTNRLESKIVEPSQTKCNLSSAISPTSSTSSTASLSAHKAHTYDSGSYSNCEITFSNESSTQTTPIKRETSYEQPMIATTTAAAPLLTYMNASMPNNFYQAKLASFLQSSASTGQLQSFLQNLSAFAPVVKPTAFGTPNATAFAPAVAPTPCFQPAAPVCAIDHQNYIQFFNKLAAAATILSNSVGATTAALPEMRTSATANIATADLHHSQLLKRCHSEDEESQGSPSTEEHGRTVGLGPFPKTADSHGKNGDLAKAVKLEGFESSTIKLDVFFDDNNNNGNHDDDQDRDHENNSDVDAEFEERSENSKRSSPPSSNDSVNDNDAEKPFACTHTNCHKRFTNKFLLKKHQFIHTGLRPHACPFCSKRFNRKDNLLRHKKTHLANNGDDLTARGADHMTTGRRRHNANNMAYDAPTEAAMKQLMKSAFPNGALYSAAAASFSGLGAASMLTAGLSSTASSVRRRARSKSVKKEPKALSKKHVEEDEDDIIDPVAIDEY